MPIPLKGWETYQTYCYYCHTVKPWKHDQDPHWLIFLRKVKQFFKGEWKITFTWY